MGSDSVTGVSVRKTSVIHLLTPHDADGHDCYWLLVSCSTTSSSSLALAAADGRHWVGRPVDVLLVATGDSRTWRILRVELVTIDCLVMAHCRWEAEGS